MQCKGRVRTIIKISADTDCSVHDMCGQYDRVQTLTAVYMTCADSMTECRH